MNLLDFVSVYAHPRDITSGSVEQLKFAVRCFERFLGRSADLEDLNADTVNGWLRWGLEHFARATMRGRRGALLCLWRDAYDRGLITVEARLVRPIRTDTPMPQAWTLDEMEVLIQEAMRLPGRFRNCGVLRGRLMAAWFSASYYTGLRNCDLFALTVRQVLSGGVLAVRQSKTREPVYCPLPDDLIARVRLTLPPHRELVFPIRRKVLKYWFDKVAVAAGVCGTPKWARRTGATQLEIIQPGAAMAYLGHKTPGLAYKHYVDLRQVQRHKPLPPRPGAA